ncbi:hypothetical protein FRC07_000105 [Ceratobasidium sp. 392]|nr:hypothetical protein FRC07_000105 [Ceratobasidium sp. 392]
MYHACIVLSATLFSSGLRASRSSPQPLGGLVVSNYLMDNHSRSPASAVEGKGKGKEPEGLMSLFSGLWSSNQPPARDHQATVNKRPSEHRVTATTSKYPHSSPPKHRSSRSSSHSYNLTRTTTKLLVQPANDLSPNARLDRVLHGETHVISYPGTSQYSQGAPSACGLAALNAIRVTFDASSQGTSGVALVKWLSTREAHLDATSICAHWPNRGHLEPDELFQLPIFRHTINVYDRQDQMVGFRNFLSMMNTLQTPQALNDVTAALITRPPEMLSVFRVPIASDERLDLPTQDAIPCVYAIFDSHSRPHHPNGAGLILLPSVTTAANYLASLLHVPSGIRSSEMQWEAQLMSQFSSHFVYQTRWRDPQEERSARLAALYEANAGILYGQEVGAEVKKSQEEAKKAWNEMKKAQDELDWLKTKVQNIELELNDAYDALDAVPRHAGPGILTQRLPGTFDDPTGGENGLSEDTLLALRMQEEFDVEDQLLASLAEESTFAQSFNCGVCFETFHTGALASLEGCGHPFCRECMYDYVQSQLETRTFPILCPSCRSVGGGIVPGTVGQELIEMIGLTEQQYSIYVELSLASHSTVIYCRKCERAAFVMRADLDGQARAINCPLPDCSHKWCKNCNVSIEEGVEHSCDGTNELKKLMTEQGWKDCPACKTTISRTEGCYHMTCRTPGCNGFTQLEGRLPRFGELRPSGQSLRNHQATPNPEHAVATSSKSSRSTPSRHRSVGSSSQSYNPSRSLIRPPVELVGDLSPDAKLDRVLRGETHVIAYPGTSQYSRGAPSACGLAALNVIRVTFHANTQDTSGIDLVKWLSTRQAHVVGTFQAMAQPVNDIQFIQDATAICTYWPRRDHLEPDSLLPLPMFQQAMKVYDRQDQLVGFRSFVNLINALQTAQALNDVTAALITRPPEMLSVFRIPLVSDEQSDLPVQTIPCIYAVFDSHSRPQHPKGAGLTLLPSVTAAANYLASLLHVPSGVKSSDMQWEAQLMSQFSAHLVCRAKWRSPQEERRARLAALYEANAGMLRSQDTEAEVKKAQEETSEAQDVAQKIQNEVKQLKAKLQHLELELRHARYALDDLASNTGPRAPIHQPFDESDENTDDANEVSEDTLLALRMQEEFNAEDQLFTSLVQKSGLAQSFECGICFETFHAGALAPMDGPGPSQYCVRLVIRPGMQQLKESWDRG